jgi:molybdenum cofactor guanylyltransferase
MSPATPKPISGVVIAGGRSRRLGHDKRALRLWGAGGPRLLEHTLAVLAPLCAELIVALNDPADWPDLPARLVADQPGDVGPLGGLCAGLAAATHETALVVAADMPLLSADLLRALIAEPAGYDALVPRTAHGLEPLHALYRRSCRAPLQAYLADGGRSISGFLATVRVATPAPGLIERYDPHGHAFLNLNTPEDLALAQRLIGGA